MTYKGDKFIFVVESSQGTGTFVPTGKEVGAWVNPAGIVVSQADTVQKVGVSESNIAVAFGTYSSNASSQVLTVVPNNVSAIIDKVVFTGPATPVAGSVTIRPFAQNAASPKAIIVFNQTASPGTTGTAYGNEVEIGVKVKNGFLVEVATAGQSFFIAYRLIRQ